MDFFIAAFEFIRERLRFIGEDRFPPGRAGKNEREDEEAEGPDGNSDL